MIANFEAVLAEVKAWIAKPKQLLVAGQWRDGCDGKTFPSLNPATGEVLANICEAGYRDVNEAVSGARIVFERGDWARLPLKERADVLWRLGDLILQRRAQLAILESLDTGKPVRESYEGDVPRAALNFHFFADYALHEEEPCYRNTVDTHISFREPMGVVALITPWNLPLYLETWKLAPALVMGNSCVLKPSELTPLSAIYLAELATIAGIPPGVINVLQGHGEKAAGEQLCNHPGVDAISFTGETSTGRAIMRSAAIGPTRVSFELGGKGAMVICADASWENALTEATRAAFRNQGEICLACPRIFVERSRYSEFVDAFVKRTQEIVVGDPLDPRTGMGALISQEHWDKVTGYLKRVEKPGEILTGGTRPTGLEHGYFLSPTVVTNVGQDHPISREEVFGPVVAIYPFDTEREVVAAVNGTPYGLSASIWTNDLQRADRMSRAIRTGLVWINCWFVRDLRVPFGGQKRSGLGREGGRHSLDFYSEWKSICARMEAR